MGTFRSSVVMAMPLGMMGGRYLVLPGRMLSIALGRQGFPRILGGVAKRIRDRQKQVANRSRRLMVTRCGKASYEGIGHEHRITRLVLKRYKVSLIETMVAFYDRLRCSAGVEFFGFSTDMLTSAGSDREHGRVLRPRLNPWIARRCEDLAEEDLASPLHVPGRCQIFNANHVIVRHCAFVLAAGLARLGWLALFCHGIVAILAP